MAFIPGDFGYEQEYNDYLDAEELRLADLDDDGDDWIDSDLYDEDDFGSDLYDEPDQFRDDVEADADALASAGYGTDEDYGYDGMDYDFGMDG